MASVRQPDYRVSAVVAGLMGFLLAVLAVAGMWHGQRAARAQYLYRRAKADPDVPVGIRARCDAAQRLYPYNYHLLVWGAEQAFARAQVENEAHGEALDEARYLCDAGLALNPYRVPLPSIKTSLLRIESLDAAIDYWEAFVDWDYWNPFNHAFLVDLYSADGQFGKAARSLRLIEGTGFAAAAKASLHRAWVLESTRPNVLSTDL